MTEIFLKVLPIDINHWFKMISLKEIVKSYMIAAWDISILTFKIFLTIFITASYHTVNLSRREVGKVHVKPACFWGQGGLQRCACTAPSWVGYSRVSNTVWDFVPTRREQTLVHLLWANFGSLTTGHVISTHLHMISPWFNTVRQLSLDKDSEEGLKQ